MSDNIIILRGELKGRLTPRWTDLTSQGAVYERLACNLPDDQSLAEWHYENALASLAAAAEMKRLGFG